MGWIGGGAVGLRVFSGTALSTWSSGGESGMNKWSEWWG